MTDNELEESPEVDDLDAAEAAADEETAGCRNPVLHEPLVTSFEAMTLNDVLKQNLRDLKFVRPSAIQSLLIPRALQNIDVIGQSKTGTGKTAAFILPILQRITEAPVPQAIVLCPTRELVNQVKEESLRLRGPMNVKVAAIYGGLDLRQQMNELNAGVQLVVGSPGRVLDMMQRGCLKTAGIRTVVLDEADRMLDIGFRPDIEKILSKMPRDRQTLLLSATMPPMVLRLAQRYMKSPQTINVSGDDLSVPSIDQRVFSIPEERKFSLLMHLLVREKPRRCLIFCQMKSGVRRLSQALSQRIRGCMGMEGDMNQRLRNRVMQDFRDGRVRFLVATDVVGRGIDVNDISHVINYDIPEDAEAYVHRIGRTGRMGKEGKSFTFVTPEQGPLLTQIEILINKQLTPDSIGEFVTQLNTASPDAEPTVAPSVT